MSWMNTFYLDKEKDIEVELFQEGEKMTYVLRTPNHGTGNLITNLAKLCDLPLFEDESGLKIIRGEVPCYIDGYNRSVYIFRLGGTKVANIWEDGRIEMKAQIPAISKTLMSQTKDYRGDIEHTIVKTYIRKEVKFRSDLHTHMNGNLSPDVLIALGIMHQIRYPLYYVKKLGLSVKFTLLQRVEEARIEVAKQYADSGLTGKYLTRRIDDHTYLNFAELILGNLEDATYNIAKIRASLAVMKDGQAVFTNLEKVYLYRYVFTKGVPADDPIKLKEKILWIIPDLDVGAACAQMWKDRENPAYAHNTLFQDKLLWIARSYQKQGITYAEISDTTLVKGDSAAHMLAQVHEVMPKITEETGVTLRFLAALRRIPLTIVKDNIVSGDYFRENLQVLRAVASDPYVAGSDIVGEEITDIRDLSAVIKEIVGIAAKDSSFVVRIHAGENDSLRDNVTNSLMCVKEALAEGQRMPQVRIGHGLYTPNLKSAKGRALIRELRESGAVVEFQITSNVRLNNLSLMENHPIRHYLRAGISCVQGTDGGALYGTDSIDEQLSLEKMLGLTFEELGQMRESEAKVMESDLAGFARKQKTFAEEAGLSDPADIERYYEEKIAAEHFDDNVLFRGKKGLASQEVLADRIEELPPDGVPIVIVGGSFNNDKRTTRVKPEMAALIDQLLSRGDPSKVFFVIGHRLSGYEKYLVEKNQGRYRIYAMLPTVISETEYKRLRESGVRIRISIEPEAMGIYKSLAYEIFKRRPSILLAFDGNSAGQNMIQEAKNSKYPCRKFVNRHCRALREKAEFIEGYMTLFDEKDDVAGEVLKYVGEYQET
ncbi:MAG: adenosine deaminase [Lachnospiraceae bacterium]|nr:adenosine deaminase [Lachnospiraceae bacterium]